VRALCDSNRNPVAALRLVFMKCQSERAEQIEHVDRVEANEFLAERAL